MAHENNRYCFISIEDIENLDYSELSYNDVRKNLAETQFVVCWKFSRWGETTPVSVVAANIINIYGRSVHSQKQAREITLQTDWT